MTGDVVYTQWTLRGRHDQVVGPRLGTAQLRGQARSKLVDAGLAGHTPAALRVSHAGHAVTVDRACAVVVGLHELNCEALKFGTYIYGAA